MNITFHNKWVKIFFWAVIIIIAGYFLFTVVKPTASITLGVGNNNSNPTGK